MDNTTNTPEYKAFSAIIDRLFKAGYREECPARNYWHFSKPGWYVRYYFYSRQVVFERLERAGEVK